MATDLAKFAIEIAQSRNGKSNKVLSQKMVEEMLTPVLNGAGLGFFAEKENLIKKFLMYFVGPIQFVMEVRLSCTFILISRLPLFLLLVFKIG